MADNTIGKTVHITSEKVAELAKSTNEKPEENSTIFDDVLKTIQEKIPELAVPLINEIFGTDYPADIPVIPWRQEHHTRNGKIYVDTHLLIGNKRYHLEYQIKNDGTMVIRMWEYDAAIALENVEEENGKYRIRFPSSCVLQLRGKNRFDRLEMKVIFQDGQTMTYSVPVIWLSDYTKDKIFQKRLIFLLPFYIMKYEKKIQKLESNSEYLESMLEEYREIEHYLEAELLEKDKEKAFRDIIELIRRISDYILRDSEKTKTEVDHIMGGKVLKLQTDIELERIEQAEKRAEKRGVKSTKARLNSLNQRLISAGRIDDLSRSCMDPAFQDELLKEYGL